MANKRTSYKKIGLGKNIEHGVSYVGGLDGGIEQMNPIQRRLHLSHRHNNSKCYGVAIALLFAHPLFSNLLPGNMSYFMFVAGFCLALFLFFRDDGVHFNLKTLGIHGAWAFVAIYAFGSFALGNGRNLPAIAVLSLSIIVMLCAANSMRWLNAAAKCLTGMLLVFALTTIAMYLFPSLSIFINNTVLLNSKNFMGYQSGITAHYSNNGLFNAIGSVISFCFFQLSGSRSQRFRWGVLLVLFFSALMLTGKRTGFVCALAAMIIVYLTSAKSGKSLKLLVVLLFGGYLIIVFGPMVPGLNTVIDRFSEALNSGSLEDSTSGRTLLWDYAIEGWLRNPFFGHGWSSYYYVWPSGLTVSSVSHNELLNLLYETGIMGTLLVVVCMMTSLISTIKLVATNKRGSDGLYLRISLGIQVYTLVYGFTMGGILYSPTYFCFYLISISIMLAFYCKSRQHIATLYRPSFGAHC